MRHFRSLLTLFVAACATSPERPASRLPATDPSAPESETEPQARPVSTFEASAAGAAFDDIFDRFIIDQTSDLLDLFRHLHEHPELSLEEQHTAARVAAELDAAGYAVAERFGGYGVVGVLENGAGPTLLIRTDLDALPVSERTGLPYASVKDGKMHACGHDLHMTVLVGAARALAKHRDRWNGCLVLIAQPAEEIGKGARMMLEAGLFEKFPKPDNVIALHVAADLPAGSVGTRAGWAFANVDSVDITVHGKGAHGAAPHLGIDPIVISAHLVLALQTIVSRRVNPIESAVVTVGSLEAGTKHNIIPDQAHLKLTVRSYEDQVRDLVIDEIKKIALHTCRAHGCPKDPDVVINGEGDHTPAGYNDPGLTAAATRVFRRLLGEHNVHEVPPTMGGEDFGHYTRKLGVPGLMFRLGTVSPEAYAASKKGGPALPSLHSPVYRAEPKPSIQTGVRAMTALALSLLAPATP